MFDTAHLTPEQNKAISCLESALVDLNSNLILLSELTLPRVTTTGDMFFVEGTIKTSNIPRDTTWIWNQSRGRQTFSDHKDNIEVNFFKLNTKKSKKHTNTPPPYKLWVFHIQFTKENKKN